ncbi:MAG: J domain-containing protein [Alphaproteobacteria bacterium]|nr:MAG: J domain-containing protein [Alphaproteobacteria bacterium]
MSEKGPRDFGFPRWGGYQRERSPVSQRMCDHQGCNERGDHPAPRGPFTRERWYFCRRHAAEYNRNWNFFAGMSEEAIRNFMAGEQAASRAWAQSASWSFAADSWSSGEKAAFAALELDPGADLEEVKASYRRLAKKFHPDLAGSNDENTARRFQEIQTAYDILSRRLGMQDDETRPSEAGRG